MFKFPEPALSEAPAFAKKLIDNGTISARALLFCMLTASRTAMVTGATWREVEGDALRIPARRMKNGEEFLIPLVPAMLALLGERTQPEDYLFPGARKGKPLSQQALLEMMRGIVGRGEAVPHGLRSTFRTWAGEKTNFPREVIEMALAHVVGSQVERAYMRGTLFDKRRELMQKLSYPLISDDSESLGKRAVFA